MISKEAFLVESTVSAEDLRKKILPYREQERIRNEWLVERFETVLPRIMRRCGIDLWVVACNEYNEDPVFCSMVPAAMITARRTAILAFHLNEEGKIRRMALTRPNIGLDDYYELMWTNQKGSAWQDPNAPYPPETQFECLARIIRELDPKSIGFNMSENFAFGDGLTHTLYRKMVEAMDEKYVERIVSAENLCVGWLETRTEREMAAYTGIMQIAHAMIDEAFSSRVVTPGITTNADVKYFMMQKVIDLGLVPWFDFSVSITREKVGTLRGEHVIMPGDILHCDVGLKYLGLCTDTQENAYVLKLGETDAPQYLKDALRQTNRFQEIVCSNYKEGRSGNEILKLSLEQAFAEGLKPSLYTHPIGYHGHGAGPTIGLTDMQGGVPGRGDYLLYNDTAYSLELNCTVDVKEWETSFRMCLETDVLFTNDEVYYLAGRQENFHLIK
ncbi:MAG: M24 family metallopeptidase [Erysipelotrichaceae bacterium]|nr:M24 family metallopeptidase [Erysipelotrichaceae bacterium]